jgi:acyl-CoA dehydrogenase
VPHARDWADLDRASQQLLDATAEFFESRSNGGPSLQEFLELARRERLFATLLTPTAEADGDPGKRWDCSRIAAMSELLGWYGLRFWELWQSAIVGTCATWQSDRQAPRRDAAARLERGATFALALKERGWSGPQSAGLLLVADPGHGFLASGDKYHAGGRADVVAVFGRQADIPGPAGHVLFTLDTSHAACRVDATAQGTELQLDRYPVANDDVLCTGPRALLAAHDAMSFGQLTLGFGIVGMCSHALHDAVSVSRSRLVGNRRLSSYAHVRRRLVECYARVTAMRMFATRATDYVRSATADDQRYLLYVLAAKVVLSSESQRVVDGLLEVLDPEFDVIGGRGLSLSATDEPGWRALTWPAIEPRFHLHKFMANYMLRPTLLPEVPVRAAGEDVFVIRSSRPASYRELRVHDWRAAYGDVAEVANVSLLAQQAEGLCELLEHAPLSAVQQQDLDFLEALRRMFTVVVYGQLVLEQARTIALHEAVLDQIFEALVADFSGYAVALQSQPLADAKQRQLSLAQVRRPHSVASRRAAVWEEVLRSA